MTALEVPVPVLRFLPVSIEAGDDLEGVAEHVVVVKSENVVVVEADNALRASCAQCRHAAPTRWHVDDCLHST